MLVQIDGSVVAANSLIVLHPADNVAIARTLLSPDQLVDLPSCSLVVKQPIPPGHKVATSAIPKGQFVYRYGEVVGTAKVDIGPGDHVHEHNLAFYAHDLPEHFVEPDLIALVSTRSFLGFARDDGRVGTRNYIAVVGASNCAAHAVTLIAESYAAKALPANIDGVVCFPHGDGCGQAMGPDTQQLQRTLSGVLHHPNVAAAIIVGLGCEVNQIDHYLRSGSVQGLTLQSTGGTSAVVEEANRRIATMLERCAGQNRVTVPASHLVLGLNCGGSDSFSGITANPALGYCSDLIVREGGTVVLAETTEIFGAQHLLLRRARNRDVASKLNAVIGSYRTYLQQFGTSFNDNPSPGNKEGGLTNIVEKSLGAVAKSGTTPLNGVLDYAERISGRGLLFMNTPGYDPVSLAGLAAGGVNLIAFTTGRGSAIGFPNVPVLKIASNSALSRRMPENIDINAGEIADGTQTIAEAGAEIFERVLRIASGEKTKAESLGHNEFVPWRIGPVL